MLRKPRLDNAPAFSTEVKQVIGTEACKLTGDASCRVFVNEYPFDAVEFRRRRTADYENMFLYVSMRLQRPLSESRWMSFQSTLMSTSWLNEVNSKIQVVPQGSCTKLTQASYPQQSGECWSFDNAVNPSENQHQQTQNEFCSIRLKHENAMCAINVDEDGLTQRARRVSMASFDALDCANKVAESMECGASFSWNPQNGVCICSTPGNICNGAHVSEGGNVYIFRSGNFGYFGFENEESEELKNNMEEEAANAVEQSESEAAEQSETEPANPPQGGQPGMLHRGNGNVQGAKTTFEELRAAVEANPELRQEVDDAINGAGHFANSGIKKEAEGAEAEEMAETEVAEEMAETEVAETEEGEEGQIIGRRMTPDPFRSTWPVWVPPQPAFPAGGYAPAWGYARGASPYGLPAWPATASPQPPQPAASAAPLPSPYGLPGWQPQLPAAAATAAPLPSSYVLPPAAATAAPIPSSYGYPATASSQAPVADATSTPLPGLLYWQHGIYEITQTTATQPPAPASVPIWLKKQARRSQTEKHIGFNYGLALGLVSLFVALTASACYLARCQRKSKHTDPLMESQQIEPITL